MSNQSKHYDDDYVSDAIELHADGSGRIIPEKFFQSEKVQETLRAAEELMKMINEANAKK